MAIEPYDYNFNLCLHWLYNAKNNVLNEEILNLQISYHGINTFQTAKTLVRTIMNEQLEDVLEDSKGSFATKSYSLYFTTTLNIPDIKYEDNRNIILVTPFPPNFTEIHRPLLCVNLKNYSINLNNRHRNDPLSEDMLNKLINHVEEFSHKPQINEYDEHKCYIKKLPLQELIINKEYKKIGDFIHEMILFESCPIKRHKLLLDTEYSSSKEYYKNLIVDDIRIFVEDKILLKRLSIVMYRLCFFKFDADVSKLTKFFTQTLVLGDSENLYLSNLNFISRDLNNDTAYDVYDFRNLESKQTQLAEQIIVNEKMRYGDEADFEFDKDLIHEVTHLSYAQIKQLINKDLI